MSNRAQQLFWNTRRFLLKALVPEIVWPKTIILDGVSFALRNTPYSFGTKTILKSGAYEVSERKLIGTQIRPEDVVIEMGGSIGVLTALIAHYAYNGKVISVEASHKITDYSKKWLGRQKNIEVVTGYGFPVYSLDSRVSVDGFNDTLGSLGGVVSFTLNEPSPAEREGIFDIKKLSETFNVEPTVLVIDIEGTESIFLEQVAALPSSIRLILIELHPHFYGPDKTEKIKKCIEAEGFELAAEDTNVYLFKRPARS